MDRPFPAYKGDEPYMFVCYAHENTDIVYPELRWLQDQKLNIGMTKESPLGKSGEQRSLTRCTLHPLTKDDLDVVPVFLDDAKLTPVFDSAFGERKDIAIQ